MIMPRIPPHQDIGVTLANYEKEKAASKPDAATKAYISIIDELAYRGWFERFPKLPRETLTFFYVLFADDQINNGGFAQYFCNGYGKYAEDTVVAYKSIGAVKKAALLATVMASFPDGKYPRTVDEYSDLLEKKADELAFLNEDLEKGYYNSSENIQELMISYIRKHFDKFAP